MRVTLALASALAILASGPSVSAQQAAEAEAESESEASAPTTPPYMLKVQNGLRLAVGRDFEGAMAALREAMQLSPTEPEAHYYLGEVQRMQGNLAEALESFRTSQRMAQENGKPGWQARAMQGAAETLERQENQLEAARQAWTEYARFADANRQVSNPEIARARIQAIDAVTEQERAYVAVRERIAARERENAQGQQGAQNQNQRRRQR